jgi:polysaccharide biosynthesis protein PslH
MIRILVYKPNLAWPRRSGHDVHTYEMMRMWARLGAQVHFVTARKPLDAALDGLDLASATTLSEVSPASLNHRKKVGRLAQSYTRYWGIPESYVDGIANLAGEVHADAVIVSGLDALPLLSKIDRRLRIWYAADEWLWHHLSLIQLRNRSTWAEMKMGLVKGLYERAFRRYVDRVWVVSKIDRRAVQTVMGVRAVDILPNGVDAQFYSPQKMEETERSIVFWGRLDFDPNIQALKWFCSEVWPRILVKNPGAVFTVIGAKPVQAVLDLVSMPGIRVLPDLDDLRPEVARHQIAVLPFISGAGVKNKLLEAAAMSKAIVCSPKAAAGLLGSPPVCVAISPASWQQNIQSLWEQPSKRRSLGLEAREWVCSNHVWEKAARDALDSIRDGLNAKSSL